MPKPSLLKNNCGVNYLEFFGVRGVIHFYISPKVSKIVGLEIEPLTMMSQSRTLVANSLTINFDLKNRIGSYLKDRNKKSFQKISLQMIDA